MPNAITYSALIGACAEGDKAARALEPFQEIVDRGLVPRVITYSALSVPSQGATRQHGPWSSSRLCGPRPGAQRHHIQRLDLGRAEGDKAARALALLQDMRDLGPCAQRITYSALICACAEGDRVARALELVQLMRAQGPGAQRHPLQLLD